MTYEEMWSKMSRFERLRERLYWRMALSSSRTIGRVGSRLLGGLHGRYNYPPSDHNPKNVVPFRRR